MRLDHNAAPATAFKNDASGLMHVVGSFFNAPWCDEDNDTLELDLDPTDPDEVAENIDRIDWCAGCLEGAKEEGLILA